MGFFSELKQRSVIRVAVFYLGAAWLLIQVVDVVLPRIGVPEAAIRLAIIVLMIGFVPAVVLAWIFELTPDGIKRNDEVDHDHPSVRQRQKRFDRVVLVILALAVTYFSIDKFILDPIRDKELEKTAELQGRVQALLDAVPDVSIAVMPFEFEGNNSEYEILASGIPDRTINRLTAFEGVDVRDWSTVRLYKNQEIDVIQVADRLDVTHVFTGTVRVAGDNVQVIGRLIDGTTNVPLEPYESEPRQLSTDSIFDVQNHIAGSIADMLKIELASDSAGDLGDVGTDNLDAYLAYSKGREALWDRTSSQIDAAIDSFVEATELDPMYANPYSGLHDACALYYSYTYNQNPKCKQFREGRKEYLDTALDLDDSLGEAWISLGYAHLARCGSSDEEKAKAHNAMRKGLLLSPASAHAFHWYALFLHDRCNAVDEDEYTANLVEYERVLLKGLTIAPLYVTFHQLLAYHYSRQGDADKAFEVANRMRKQLPDSYKSYTVLANLEYSMNGSVDQYIKHLLEAYAHYPEDGSILARIADAYISLGDTERALQYLQLTEDLGLIGANLPWRLVSSTAVATLLTDGADAAEAYLLENIDSPNVWPVVLHWLLLNLELADGRTDDANARLKKLNAICDSPRNYCLPARYMWTARMMQELGNDETARKLVQDTWEPLRQEFDRFGSHRIGILGVGINKAMVLSMLGEHENALAELQGAVEDGWRGYCSYAGEFGEQLYCLPNWQFVAEHDAMFDGIRGRPEFSQAFDIIEQDMAEQRESLCEMERNGELNIPEAIAALDAQGEC